MNIFLFMSPKSIGSKNDQQCRSIVRSTAWVFRTNLFKVRSVLFGDVASTRQIDVMYQYVAFTADEFIAYFV